MSRIFRYHWFTNTSIHILVILLLFTLSCANTPTTTSKKPTPTSSTPEVTPTQLPRTPQASATPTQTGSPPGNIKLLRLSSDPYTNSASQHQTELEPASYSYGSTIVATFQAGRFRDTGSTNIGWATSPDSGSTWQNGFLRGTTKVAGGAYDRITDPAVIYDAAHNTWMIATVGFLELPSIITAPAILVSLSTDGGITWSKPVTVADAGRNGQLDKDWITCDNTATSKFYGHCYVEWDNFGQNDLIQMSTSTDGGRTWGTAKTTGNRASGISGEPLVQPSGTVIVPIVNGNETAVMAFRSTNGGISWTNSVTITSVTSFSRNAYYRANILLSAAIDGSGKVYLAWVDCRFETACNGNDLVMTTSTNGLTWSPVQRIPIAPIGSGTNYYVSGLGADPATSGSVIHLGLVYYYYSAGCSSNCNLSVGFVSSTDSGITWSTKTKLAGPMPAAWIASGRNKVGDYVSISFLNGKAFPVFAAATEPSGGHLNEAIYTIQGGLQV